MQNKRSTSEIVDAVKMLGGVDGRERVCDSGSCLDDLGGSLGAMLVEYQYEIRHSFWRETEGV